MRKIDKRVTVGMSQELYDTLDKLAKEDFRSVSNYIWFVLREYVKKTAG